MSAQKRRTKAEILQELSAVESELPGALAFGEPVPARTEAAQEQRATAIKGYKPILREWKFGTHTAHFEQPDILWVKIHGETTLQDAISLSELYGELGNKNPFFVVTDLTEATSVETEAREHVSKSINPKWFLGSVYIGAGFVHKAVAKSLAFVHAMTDQLTFDMHFVATEQEARELIVRESAKKQGHRVA